MNVLKGTEWREFAPALIIVANSLIWYTLLFSSFTNLLNNQSYFTTVLLYGSFFVAIAASALFGGWLFPRARKLGLYLWILFGTIMSIPLGTVPSNGLFVNLIIFILLGASAGIGLPSALAFFANSTRIAKRGMLGGIIWGMIGLGVLSLGYIITLFGPSEPTLVSGLLAIWRFLGLGFFLALPKVKQEPAKTKTIEKYKRILVRRDVVLYFVPWIMFSLVNFVESPITKVVLGDFYTLATLLTFAISGIVAIIGGTLADRIGRKRVVITGFIFYGVEYAILSLFYSNPISWYIYICFDGTAWGMFAAVFFMSLWGDLSEGFAREKYYVIGGLPYLLAGFLPILIGPLAENIGASYATSAFSIASFFLFIAVLPLIYAPETLPEKTMKDRDLSSYVEKAKKYAEKQGAKRQDNTDYQNKDIQGEIQVSTEERKARELAEKFY
jgi:MFS family permease